MLETDPLDPNVEISSYGETTVWITYDIIILLSSLIGDSIILVGTIKYKAIKLHRVLVVVIQHLAVSDLLQSIFVVLPQTISLITKKWILGEFLCHMNDYVQHLCSYMVTALLTCMFSISKLLVVLFPLKTSTWSRKSAHLICSIFWLIGFLQPSHLILMFFTTNDSLYFTYRDYSCNYHHYTSNVPEWLKSLKSITPLVFGPVPLLLLIVSSVWLLITARKTAADKGEHLRWRGIVTVILTNAVYLGSILPFLLYNVAKQFNPLMPGRSEPCPILMKFWILCLDELNRLFMSKFEVLAPHGARKLLVAYATSRLDRASLKTCLVAYAATRLGQATFFPPSGCICNHIHVF